MANIVFIDDEEEQPKILKKAIGRPIIYKDIIKPIIVDVLPSIGIVKRRGRPCKGDDPVVPRDRKPAGRPRKYIFENEEDRRIFYKQKSREVQQKKKEKLALEINRLKAIEGQLLILSKTLKE